MYVFMKKACVLFLIILLLAFFTTAVESYAHVQSEPAGEQAAEDKVIYIGVLANRSYELCLLEWGPTADYLSERIPPYEFRILPFGFDEVFEEVSRVDRRISFISANPSLYAYMEYHGLARRIATLQIPGVQGPKSSFGGVILTRADRTDIRKITDLRNKHFAAVDSNSLGGYHAALREIYHAGLNPARDFRSVEFVGTHDEVVRRVLSGEVDAGTVRSTQLERMEEEGLIDFADIHIINSQAERFPEHPYLLSTQLYPEWPFAAITGTDEELSKSVALALLMMDADHPAARLIRGAGWTVPEQYTSVHELLRELLFPPYDDYGITLGKTINQFGPLLLTMLILFVAVLGFGILAYFLKRRAQLIADKLIKSETQFTKLFDNAPVSILVMSSETADVIDANKKAIESYGVKSLEELQKADIWGKPPYSFNEVLQLQNKLLKEGPQRFEWKSRNVQGEYFWEDVLIQEIDFGSQKRIVAISNDITDRKKIEESLRESESKLQELNIQKDKFFSIIAHDLKSPFTSIIGFSELLTNHIKQKKYDKAQKYAQIINQSSEVAVGLLMNLLDWANSQTGRMRFNPKHHLMAVLIGEPYSQLKDAADQKSIKLHVEAPPELPVLADKDMISTVLRNLISNAIKFTRTGGEVTISANQTDNEIIVSVKDNGLGLAADKIATLFQIHTSESTPGTNQESGTGLGLILCKEFVEKHGGSIWVESKVDEGSVFSFSIPREGVIGR